MERHKIIMNFSAPPSLEDLEALAQSIAESLPDELQEFCESLALTVEELPDETMEVEMNLDDPFEMVALFKSGAEIAPGITRKTANDDDTLMIFRRPLLDLWCETQEDLNVLLRQVMIEELGRSFDFSEREIEDMTKRHSQIFL